MRASVHHNTGMRHCELREARFGDGEAVATLMRRNALIVQSTSRRWDWLWERNPAMHEQWPIGWVLEGEGGIVGYLGNVPSLFWFRGKRLRAASARSFVVDPPFRGSSLRLAGAYFLQGEVDLLLNTSANATAGQVFRLCKARQLPQRDYDIGLLWITDPKGFLGAFARQRGYPNVLSRILTTTMLPAAFIAFQYARRHFDRACLANRHMAVDVIEPDCAGPEFEAMWSAYREAHPDRLLADRSAAALRWHFGTGSAAERRSRVLAVSLDGMLLGYAVVTREDSERLGLKRLRVSDLLAMDDDPLVIDTLLAAAHRTAREDGAHVLDLIGFPTQVRSRALANCARPYALDAWRYWYKVPDDGELDAELGRESAWYASPYDGDATL